VTKNQLQILNFSHFENRTTTKSIPHHFFLYKLLKNNKLIIWHIYCINFMQNYEVHLTDGYKKKLFNYKGEQDEINEV
jgi:hypothetical protein